MYEGSHRITERKEIESNGHSLRDSQNIDFFLYLK